MEETKKGFIKSRSIFSFIILMAIAFAAFYGYAEYTALNQNLKEMDFTSTGVQVKGYTLLPPSADLTLTATVYNKSSYNVVLNGRIDYYLNNNYVSSFDITNQLLTARSTSIVNMNTQLSASSLINLLLAKEKINLYSGQVTYSAKLFGFIPVEYVKNIG